MRMQRHLLNSPLMMLCATLFLCASAAVLCSGVHAAEVNVPDPNLAAAIRSELGIAPGDPITDTDLAGLTILEAQSQGISDLTGLEWATNLEALGLKGNSISSIGALSGLTNLEQLGLADNGGISSIGALSGLINLDTLGLANNSISDIGALSGLTNLDTLGLEGNNISSGLGALAGMTRLTELPLKDNNISDLSGLAGMTWLRTLGLSGNSISDIGPLSGLTSLRDLGLGGNNISSISTLSGLTALSDLDLSDNNISDLSPLVANTGFATGDGVDVTLNPLSATAITVQIPALEARGATVKFTDTTVPVGFRTFETVLMSEGIRLEWQTASERNNLGFHVYRSSSQEGEYSRMTLDIISGAGTDAADHLYEFVDETAQTGTTYWYRIQDIAFDGNAELSDPIEVFVEPVVSYQGKVVTLWAKLKR